MNAQCKPGYGPSITLTGEQIRNLLYLVNPDLDDPDQLETEATIQWMPARISDEGEPMKAGYYAWINDYPEDGVFPLDVDPTTGTDGVTHLVIAPSPRTVLIVAAIILIIVACFATVGHHKKPDPAAISAAEQKRQADAAVGAQY
jgi:hypothetical protein